MDRRVRDVMQTDVRTLSPDVAVLDLDRAFLDAGVSGFPVVEGGALVGVVSRSDVVRQICVERNLSEVLSDYYREIGSFDPPPLESLEEIGRRVGARLEALSVRDLMTREFIAVGPDEPLRAVARLFVERHIHRVPVVREGELVGIVSSLDLVRLIAEEGG